MMPRTIRKSQSTLFSSSNGEGFWEQRVKDAEGENAELRAQLAKLVARIASMEDHHASQQSRMNELHVHETETLTRQHVEETNYLRMERDDLLEEVHVLHDEIAMLKEKLDGVSATAAYVTDMASSLEDIKDANETELEVFRAKALAERQALEA
ncbi:hypothetical protein HK101_002106, partial [Irineochytrium annulatum]